MIATTAGLLAADWALPPEVVANTILCVALVLGAAMCFFGWRLFRFALALAGFACGAALSAYLAWRFSAPADAVAAANTYPAILDAMAAAPNPIVLGVWAGCGGVAGAVLSAFLDVVGVFALGAWLGATLAHATMTEQTLDVYMMTLAILAVIGGVLALLMRRPLVVISTALNGALAMMFGVYALFKNISPLDALTELKALGNDTFVLLGLTVILGAIGAYVQFSTAPEPDEKKPAKKTKGAKKKKDEEE